MVLNAESAETATGDLSFATASRRSFAAGSVGELQIANIGHLTRRLAWSIRRPAPDSKAEDWLKGLLSPKELLLYRSMSAADRAHAVDCARAVEDLSDEVVVASALHDVGKTASGLGTFGRVIATLAAFLIPKVVESWSVRLGRRGQLGRYVTHDVIGAKALAESGSAELVVEWAYHHHHATAPSTIDPLIAARLQAADLGGRGL